MNEELKNDNTLVVQPVLPIPATNIDWITAGNNNIDKLIQKQPHSEVVRHPKRPKTEEEAMTIMFDPRKAPQTSTTRVIGMSPVDPVGEFVVGGAVLGKPLQLLGKGIMYGAGRYLPSTKFGNWSRAKIISNTLNKSNVDPNKQFFYMLDDLYEKEFTFQPTTYYDKVKHRYVTKHSGRVAIHQDDNIFNEINGEAFLKNDMKLYPGGTAKVWWKVNKPYYPSTELHERIIKIPAAEINGTPVSATKSVFDRVETSGPVDITRGEAMIYNPIHGWYDRTKFVHEIKPRLKGSMELFQRQPSNTQNTWIKPFQNNMGIIDFKTSTISGNQFGKLIGEGSEQAVYLHPTDPTKVLKVYYDIDYPTLKDLRKGVNLYLKRNNVPFQLETRFEGYVTDKTGQLHPVFSQLKIESTVPRRSQNWVNNISPRLDKQMEKVGYSNSHGNYIRGTRKIIDVNPANITELPNGEFRFIDAFPEGFKTGGKVNLLKCKI